MDDPKKALVFLVSEFVDRFHRDAEGCCDREDTLAAMKTLAETCGMTLEELREACLKIDHGSHYWSDPEMDEEP